MPTPLRVLIVEDSEDDACLVLDELRRGGYEPNFERVQAAASLQAALHRQTWDVIISDYRMPEFNGIAALEIVKHSGLDIPFILVSGTIGEDLAVEAIKKGAHDYLLKDRLTRLGTAVAHELENHRLRVERRRAAEELRRTHQQLAHLLEHSPAVIYSLKVEGERVTPDVVSENITRLLGFTADECTYDWWAENLHPDDRQRAFAGLAETLQRGSGGTEYRMRHKNGAYFWVEDNERAVRDSAGTIVSIVGVWADITERKHAEDLLRENETKYRNLVELMPEGILIHRQGIVVFANRIAARYFGAKEPSELMGLSSISDLVNPESRTLMEQRLALTQEGDEPSPSAETKFIRRDQSSFNAEVLSAPFTHEGRPAVLTLIRDITEKKALQERMLRNQRLESIGTLAGGIAHDLNNVLAPILMSVELLRIRFPEERNQKLLETIGTSAERGAELIKQVLAFSKGIQGGRAPLQLRHIVREMQTIARQTFPKSVQLQIELPSDLWTVDGDATQLHQVVMNLCVNARDAMPNGGEIAIKAENFVVDEAFAKMNPEAKAQPYVVLTVTDSGTGMPPKIKERIFEPFFTTKEQGKGTGLGLATVLGIVKGHAGFITVYSEVGRGTRFKVYLPAGATQGLDQAAPVRSGLPMGHGELILIVDDEQAILEIAQQTLVALGYEALTASDGAEAVAYGAQNAAKLKLLLTDMMMPIMDGQATIRAMRRLVPGLKVIAASGLDSGTRETNPAKMGADAFLHKPFTAETLARTVHRVLTGKEAD